MAAGENSGEGTTRRSEGEGEGEKAEGPAGQLWGGLGVCHMAAQPTQARAKKGR